MADIITKDFNKGVHNRTVDHSIPGSAASDSLGWISRDDRLELSRGQVMFGNEISGAGKCYGLHFGYRADGTAVAFRKITTKVQYRDPADDTWKDTITGLTAGADYTFANYQTNAGAFVFVCGVDGLWKIPTANPASAVNLTDAAKNFKGRITISSNRTLLWGRAEDPSGLYMSYIDEGIYTTVSGESIGTGDGGTTVFSGTLAFKAAGATRTCFGVVIKVSAAVVATDDYNGNLTGSGVSGTINYATGAWTLTFTVPPAGAAPITADYQWENSNNHGLGDFSFSGTRLAGEGAIFRQDEGGSPTKNVLVFDQIYYSIKKNLVYYLNLTNDDTNATNLPYRLNSGIDSPNGAVSTSLGIVYIDTYDPENPILVRLQPNLSGDRLVLAQLAKHFDFSLYDWTECAMEAFGPYLVFSGMTKGGDNNDRLFIYDPNQDSVDIVEGEFYVLKQNAGNLYGGDALSDNVVLCLNGFDDMDDPLNNYWISKRDNLTTEELKKVKRLTFEGFISEEMTVEIYESYDNDDFELVGTISGSGDYVDTSASFVVGAPLVGGVEVGGGGDYPEGIETYRFLYQVRLRTAKFYRRRIKLVATNIGYFAATMIKDFDVRLRGNKIPRRYRDQVQSAV